MFPGFGPECAVPPALPPLLSRRRASLPDHRHPLPRSLAAAARLVFASGCTMALRQVHQSAGRAPYGAGRSAAGNGAEYGELVRDGEGEFPLLPLAGEFCDLRQRHLVVYPALRPPVVKI